MVLIYSILVAVLLMSGINAKPAEGPLQLDDVESLSDVEAVEEPKLYLILAEAVNADENVADESDLPIQKRSAEASEDLEAAAGTNVLRPLFVYRQQLAYRERVKKGALRRLGIRPGF